MSNKAKTYQVSATKDGVVTVHKVPAFYTLQEAAERLASYGYTNVTLVV